MRGPAADRVALPCLPVGRGLGTGGISRNEPCQWIHFQASPTLRATRVPRKSRGGRQGAHGRTQRASSTTRRPSARAARA